MEFQQGTATRDLTCHYNLSKKYTIKEHFNLLCNPFNCSLIKGFAMIYLKHSGSWLDQLIHGRNSVTVA